MGTCESRNTKRQVNVEHNEDIHMKTNKDNNNNITQNTSASNYNNNSRISSTTTVNNNNNGHTCYQKKPTHVSRNSNQNTDNNVNISVIKEMFSFNKTKSKHIYNKWMYCFKKPIVNKNINQNIIYSNENNYDDILKELKQYTNNSKHINLSVKLLSLNERQWTKANLILFQNILSFRLDTNILLFEKFLKNKIKLNEHFNWIIWSISIYYINNQDTNSNNNNIYQNIKPPLPLITSDEWTNGFEWKGLYIKLIKEYKQIKKVKREIKALNTLFFEYIQLIENSKLNDNNNIENLLSNDFVFPLTGYCEFEGKIILVSAIIHNYNENNNFISYNNKARYDLQNSPLFNNINTIHLFPLHDNPSSQIEKYIIINAYDLLPNLLGNVNDSTILSIDPISQKFLNYKSETYLKTKYNFDLQYNLIYKHSLYDLKYKVIQINNKNTNHLQNTLNNFIENVFINNNTSSSSSSNIELKDENILLYTHNKKTLKIKYPLLIDNPSINYTNNYFLKSNYSNYLTYFISLLTSISHSITTINELNYYFDKYGINKIFKIFIIGKIQNKTAICDLLKIDILTSILTKLIYNTQTSSTKSYTTLIEQIILSMILPHKINESILKSIYTNSIKILYLHILKFNIISYTLYITNHNFNLYKPSLLFKELISTAIEKPFMFISSLETKAHFIMDPFCKYKLSINLNTFAYDYKSNDNNNLIQTSSPYVNSYIDVNDISYYMFAKCINVSNNTKIYNEDESSNFNDKKSYHSISNQNVLLSPVSTKVLLNNNDVNKVGRSFVKPSNNFVDSSRDTSHNYDVKSIKDLQSDNISIKTSPCVQTYSNMHNIINDNYNEYDVIELEYEQPPLPSIPKKNKGNNNKRQTQQLKPINKKLFFDTLNNNHSLKFPAKLYKMQYQFNNINNNNNNDNNDNNGNASLSSIYKNLSANLKYTLPKSETLEDWKNKSRDLLDLITINSSTLESWFHIHIYLFFNALYIDNSIQNSHKALKEIYSLLHERILYPPSHWFIIVNLLSGILYEKEKYFYAENYFSISLILSILNYGDPRGKNNDGHNIMTYSIWKLARIAKIMGSDWIISEYFKEMFYCINYFQKKKIRFSNSSLDVYNEVKFNSLYLNESNLIAHLDKIVIRGNEPLRSSIIPNVNDDMCNLDEDDIERPFDMLESLREHMNKMCISTGYPIHILNFQNDVLNYNNKLNDLQFPSISDVNPSYQYQEFFFGEKMFVNHIKQISKLFFVKGITFNHNDNALEKILNYKLDSKLKFSFRDEYLLNKLNIKHNLPESMLLSWGSNDKNQTSHDGYNKLTFPRMIFKLKHIDVHSIKCGTEFNLCLSKEGKVYAWGNNTKGQCGIVSHTPTSKVKYGFTQKGGIIVNDPTVIKELINKHITHISCGDEHALALDTTHNVYSWGNSEFGVLGYAVQQEYQTVPKEINYFSDNDIKINTITCGFVHNIAIDNKGDLYGWGDNKAGQLGIGDDKRDYIVQPVKIDNTYNIVSLSMKELHSLGINKECKVFSWGSSPNGQLGLGSCVHYNANSIINKSPLTKASLIAQTQIHKVTKPSEIKTFENDIQIEQVECGGAFSMFITKEGVVYGCGLNDQIQLGIDNTILDIENAKRGICDCREYTKPIRIERFNNMKVLKIACGESHCIAIVCDNLSGVTTLWSWGNNKFGQLGNKEYGNNGSSMNYPKPIAYFNQFKNAEFVDISCGFQHSVCVIRNSKRNENNVREDEIQILIKEYISVVSEEFDKIMN